MSYANHIISTPIGLNDISAATGVIGSPYDLGRMIKNSTLIKEWAKHKPTRMPGPNPVDSWRGEQKSLHGANGYSCGFSLTDYSLANLKVALDNGILGWEYEIPRGHDVVSGEYFRALDFDGYDDRATSPFVSLDLANVYVTSENASAHLSAYFTRSIGALGLSDFGILASRYFGVAIYDGSGHLEGIGTSQDSIGDALNSSLYCPMTLPSTVGTYYLYPFFSYEPQAWSATNRFTVESFVPLPFGKQTINVVSGEASMSVSGSISYTGSLQTSYITYDVVLKAKALEAVTFNNVKVRVGMRSNGGWVSYHDFTISSATTVAAGGTQTLTGQIRWNTQDDNGGSIGEPDYFAYYDQGGMIGASTSTYGIEGSIAGLTKV